MKMNRYMDSFSLFSSSFNEVQLNGMTDKIVNVVVRVALGTVGHVACVAAALSRFIPVSEDSGRDILWR